VTDTGSVSESNVEMGRKNYEIQRFSHAAVS
jgi:hypothetical protein